MVKNYKANLKDFIEYVGEPKEKDIHNIILPIVSVIYLLLGFSLLFWNDSWFWKMIDYNDGNFRVVLIIVLFSGGYLLAIISLFTINKIIWRKKAKVVTEKRCWFILKVFFIPVLGFIYIKKGFDYLFRESRQGTVVVYLPDVLIAFFISCTFFAKLLIEVLFVVKEVLERYLLLRITDEFIAFCIVFISLLFFFYLSKVMIHKSIKSAIVYAKRKELESKSKKCVKEAIKSPKIQEEIQNKYIEECKIADKQLEYTKLYIYAFINVVLLCLHFDEKDIYGKMMANQFIGITTITALFREVGGNIRNEEKQTV